MSEAIYYIIDQRGQKKGPFPIEDLHILINRHTKVWRAGMKGWVKAEQLEELKDVILLVPPTPISPANSLINSFKTNWKKVVVSLVLATPMYFLFFFLLGGFDVPKILNRGNQLVEEYYNCFKSHSQLITDVNSAREVIKHHGKTQYPVTEYDKKLETVTIWACDDWNSKQCKSYILHVNSYAKFNPFIQREHLGSISMINDTSYTTGTQEWFMAEKRQLNNANYYTKLVSLAASLVSLLIFFFIGNKLYELTLKKAVLYIWNF